MKRREGPTVDTDLFLEMSMTGEIRKGAGASTWLKLRDDVPAIVNLPVPSFAVEQLRGVAVQVERHVERYIARTGNRSFALMVTSPEQSSGKTLMAVNLALVLGRGGERRVLLIEGDYLRPRLSTFFQPEPPADHGLQPVLEGALPLHQGIFSVAKAGIDVLFAGTPGARKEMLSARGLSQLLTQLSGQYEIVVIDSPPLPVVANARVIANCSDGVLLVLRAGQSRHRDVEAGLSAIGPEKVVGMVLNAARVSRQRYY